MREAFDVLQADGIGCDKWRGDPLFAPAFEELRYWDNDGFADIGRVLEDIHGKLTTTPAPDPSPQGGGE
jgi:hypothetical protein